MAKTASPDRDGKLSINGSFNFKGDVVRLRDMLNSVIDEYGEDTQCALINFDSFPYRHTPQIIIINKNGKEQDKKS